MSAVVHVGALTPRVGGITVHCRRVLEAMRDDGIDVELINPRPGTASEDPDELIGRDAVSATVRAFRQRSPVFVHFSSNPSLRRILRLVLMVLVIRPSRLALVPHSGLFPLDMSQSSVSGRLLRWVVRRAELVICLSPEIAASVEAVAPDTRRVPGGSFIPDRTIAGLQAERGGDRSGRRRIVTSGYRTAVYGYGAVIDAWSELVDSGQLIDLHVFAYGATDEAFWGEIVRRCGERPGVTIHDDADQHDFLVALRDSDAYVRNTSNDSFGVAVSEALYLGTPALASSVCARPAGAAIFEFDDVDAIAGLVKECLESDAHERGAWGVDGIEGYRVALDHFGVVRT